MYTALVVVQVILAISIVGLVFLQQGKGANAGAAFGSGASGTVFGAQGSASFLSRATAIATALFFAVSLGLAYMVTEMARGDSLVDRVEQTAPESQGAAAGEESNPALEVIPADDADADEQGAEDTQDIPE